MHQQGFLRHMSLLLITPENSTYFMYSKDKVLQKISTMEKRNGEMIICVCKISSYMFIWYIAKACRYSQVLSEYIYIYISMNFNFPHKQEKLLNPKT